MFIYIYVCIYIYIHWCSLPIGKLLPAAKFPSHDRTHVPSLLKGSVPAWLDRIGVHSSE